MKGVIRGMAKRAVDLCEPEFLQGELNHIYKTFRENGYPPSLVHSVIQRTLANPHRNQRTTTSGPRILLPYYKGLSEKIQRLGRTLGFSVSYKRGPNLRSLLRSDKVRLPPDEHTGVVYEVKCSCSATYIGETGFTLARRFLQRMRHLTRYNNAKRELEETSPTTTRRGRPPSAPRLVAMERANTEELPKSTTKNGKEPGRHYRPNRDATIDRINKKTPQDATSGQETVARLLDVDKKKRRGKRKKKEEPTPTPRKTP
ncbi:hypothetical protein M514_13592 [Trichuris suis]|uniref:Helix-turn-helix domain-containing protein n=1 Tax=Trichuris suis TaxID=68888 RepID=A0A085MRW0_9BILA|nr:hypothetical protein M513_13592 [Trichuris suis]KFD59956.1 hypothetical protein M514_13592 [Trichuris suis]